MKDGYLRGACSPKVTQRQMDVLAGDVAAGGPVQDAPELVGIRPSTVKRHFADLRARSGLATAQLIHAGRAAESLMVPSLEHRLRGADPLRHWSEPWHHPLMTVDRSCHGTVVGDETRARVRIVAPGPSGTPDGGSPVVAVRA
jgi:hypothetical protein